MRRRLTKVVVFLLLGAIVNVGVAWGCAVGMNPFAGERHYTWRTLQDEYWFVARYERFGTTWVHSERVQKGITNEIYEGVPEQLAPKWSGLRTWSPNLRSHNITVQDRYLDGRGWPMRSLWCEVGGTIFLLRGGMVPQPVQGGIETSLSPWLCRGGPQPRVLPLRPIPLGFAINTIFYAAILWLPFAPFQLRQYVRRKRGRCIKCGYDLRGDFSSGCPECGWRREDVP